MLHLMSEPEPRSPSPGSSLSSTFEDLLVLALDRLEKEGPAGVERLLAQHPADAPRLRTHLERLHRIGLAGEPAASPEHPERMGEFRILAPIGHGGMGIVYRAVQESLGREVALKLIRPDQLFFPGARERFRREVELVARMQHPGIVPIHAVGNDGGVPFFAMELVHGATLADVVDQLVGQAPERLAGVDLDRALARCLGDQEVREPAALFAGTWTQVVLRIVREVAEALEHAHRRGVLHRDVKPSNIMLTRDGRVLLLDFGLAGGDSSERLTRTGSPLGSLAYMPPEVLAGLPGPRDARGDVYSLGVTCWELLTLQLPYQSSDPVRLRELAGAATRAKLSTVNRSVTWDIETVVATAMDPDLGRRYATASLFSRDLDNLLGHRAIEAREPGTWLRVRRWTQRHPARATALMAFSLVAVGVPSLWAWQEATARARIEKQRDELRDTNQALDAAKSEAEAESVRARANFENLLVAVDTMLTKVGDESLKDIPRMEVVRRDLLQEALRFYEGFLAEQPDDPRLLREGGLVRQRMAEMHALLGDYKEANAEATKAIAMMLAVPNPDAALAHKLAHVRTRLASSHRLCGDLSAAEAAATNAISAWQTIAAAGQAADIVLGLGQARIEASLIAADRGNLQGAFDQLEASLAEISPWRAQNAGSRAVTALVAGTLHRGGVWSFQLGRQTRDRARGVPLVENAIAKYRQAQVLWDELLKDQADAQMRADAAQCAISTAVALQALVRMAEAKAAIEIGLPLMEQLVADFPASKRRRAELANARTNYGSLLGYLDEDSACVREFELARILWQGLSAESPDNDEYAIGLAHVLQGQAAAAFGSGKPAEAVPLLLASQVAVDRALLARPDNPTYRRVRRKVAETLSEVYLAIEQHAGAAQAARDLLQDAFGPPEPALAAALLARCGPLAEGDRQLPEDERGRVVAGYAKEGRDVLSAVLDQGMTMARLRREPSLANQWDKPGFMELAAAMEKAGR